MRIQIILWPALCAALCSCVERTLDDHPERYEPEGDERSEEEVFLDLCEIYRGCGFDTPIFLDQAHCLRWVKSNVERWETDPVKGPLGCGRAVFDTYACAGLADSCEGFRTTWHPDGTNPRCDEPHARFDVYCKSRD